jgi:hypothetical protein
MQVFGHLAMRLDAPPTPITNQHDLGAFDCGVEELSVWLESRQLLYPLRVSSIVHRSTFTHGDDC